MMRLSLVLILVCAASRAWAGGFEIPEQGPAGTGMAASRTAMSDDASTIFYNPAGLTAPPGTSALLGSNLAVFHSTLRSPAAGSSSAMSVVPIPFGFVSSKVTNYLAVGIGFFDQFGSVLRWSQLNSNIFPGRFVANDTELQAINLNPQVAFGPFAGLSVGIGIDIILASATLEQALLFGDTEGSVRLGGATQAVGGNVGLLYDLPGKFLSFGFAYRSSTLLDFNTMKAHFTAPPELSATVFDQVGKTSINLPHNFGFGVAFRPMDTLTFDIDLRYTLWRSFNNLTVTFPNSTTPGLSSPQNWTDSVAPSIGMQWVAMDRVIVRLGFGYDYSPIPDSTLAPTIPGMNRWVVSGGVGYKICGFSVELSYLAAFDSARTSTLAAFPATYGQFINFLSLGVSYRLPEFPKT